MKAIFTILLFFLIQIEYAQEYIKDTLYYNQNWELTVNQEAKYYRIVNIKEGKFDGEFKDFYIPNLKIVSSGYYENGKLSKKYTEKDTSGILLIEGFFENGFRMGIWSFYYNTGKLKIKIDYSSKIQKVAEFYDKNYEHTLLKGNGKIVNDFVIGDTEYTLFGNYKNGKRHGVWTYLKTSDSSIVLIEKYSKDRFLSGYNYIENKPTPNSFLSISDLYQSDRLYLTGRYTLSSKTEYSQIPKIKTFFVYLDENFYLINNKILDGFPNDMIKSLEFDKSGNLWFAAESKGLFCIKNGKITNYKINSKDDIVIEMIHADHDGEIWVPFKDKGGYDKSGLIRIKNDSVLIFNVENSGLTCNYIKTVSSKNDSIIIGAFNCVNIYDKKTDRWTILHNPRIYTNKFDTIQIKNDQQYRSFYSMKSNKYFRSILVYDNKIWIGSFKGLDIYSGNIVFSYNEENHSFIKNNWISSLCLYNDGLLVCFDGEQTDGGISILKNGRWENLNTNNSIMIRNSISKAVIGKNGEIWMYSMSNALMMMYDERLIYYGYDNIDFKNAINDMIIDKKGNLYVATNKGILVKLKK